MKSARLTRATNDRRQRPTARCGVAGSTATENDERHSRRTRSGVSTGGVRLLDETEQVSHMNDAETEKQATVRSDEKFDGK